MNVRCKKICAHLLLPAALLVSSVSCEELDTKGRVSLTLYDQAVICHQSTGLCLSQTQTPVPAEEHRGSAYLSRVTSRYGPGGLYLYFEIRRASGAVAVMEIDAPATNQAGESNRLPSYVYKEYLQGKQLFSSTRARGKLELPKSSSCRCQDGTMELEFIDSGPDRVLGTPDDLIRRISQGLFGLDATTCRLASLTNIELHKQRVSVTAVANCPARSQKGSSNSSGSSSSSGGHYHDHGHDPYVGGCAGYPEDDDGYVDEDLDDESAGCGGDDYPEEEPSGCEGDSWDSGDSYGENSSSSDEGCEGDSTDYGDSGGCEGDSSDGWGDSGDGCGGDSSSADMDCEGDSWAASASARPGPRRRRPAQWQRAFGMVPPFIFLGLVHAFYRRRRRKRKS